MCKNCSKMAHIPVYLLITKQIHLPSASYKYPLLACPLYYGASLVVLMVKSDSHSVISDSLPPHGL